MTRLKELNSNFESLTVQDMSKYAGQWIGVVKGNIVANHNTMQEVQKEIKQRFSKEKALIGKVPENKQLILSVI
jgi:hypothetical protein